MPPAFDANTLFFWLVVIANSVDLLRSIRLPGAAIWGLRISLGIVMLTALSARLLYPAGAGWIALFAWTVLALGPTLVARAAARQAHRGEFKTARRLTRILRWFRPFERWRDLSDYYRALELEREGQTSAAEALLDKLRHEDGPFAANASVERYTALGEWAKLREFVERQRALRKADPVLAPAWLRALGELGEPAALLEAADQVSCELRAPGHARLLDQCRLFMFAFCGAPERLEQLLSGPLRAIDPVVAEVWRATAELSAGHVRQGRARLGRCLEAADVRARRAIFRRMDRPPPIAADALDEPGRIRLARLVREWDLARLYSPSHAEPRALWTTWALAALLVAVFIGEMVYGSSIDAETLLAFGALDPNRALAGEWWRIVAAQFVHFGPVHLVANVGALLLLGGFVERRFGPLRYLLVYFAAGSLALSGFVVLVALDLRPHAVLLGASANVMGIVGATAAILGRGLWAEGARIAARPLATVLLIVIGQAALDLLVTGLSFIGHALGAVGGFVVAGLLLRLRTWILLLVFASGLFLSSVLESWSAGRAAEPARPADR